jgi:hypothetical protein
LYARDAVDRVIDEAQLASVSCEGHVSDCALAGEHNRGRDGSIPPAQVAPILHGSGEAHPAMIRLGAKTTEQRDIVAGAVRERILAGQI